MLKRTNKDKQLTIYSTDIHTKRGDLLGEKSHYNTNNEIESLLVIDTTPESLLSSLYSEITPQIAILPLSAMCGRASAVNCPPTLK